MKLKAPTHHHTLERSKANKRTFRCLDPDCHFRDISANVEGKRMRCPFCDDLYIVLRVQLRNMRPRCPSCVANKINGRIDESILRAKFESAIPMPEVFLADLDQKLETMKELEELKTLKVNKGEIGVNITVQRPDPRENIKNDPA
jgi:hypothetical protein